MSLSGPFSYVFVPADEGSPIELREGDKSGGLSDDFLVKEAKRYFHEQSGGEARAAALDTANPEERKMIAKQIRQQVISSNPNAESTVSQMEDDALIDLVRTSETSASCDITALTVPTKLNDYMAVSMYGADDARRQGLSFNARATALLKACGHAPPPPPSEDSQGPAGVYGDVFVGRCHDKEDTDVWERVDFAVEDASPDSEWCTVARTRGGGGSSGSSAAASLSGLTTQAFQQSYNPTANAVGAIDQEQDGYTWTQNEEEVELKFAVAAGTKAKYVKVSFARDKLKVTVAGQTLVNGQTGGVVAVDECTYTIQDDVDKGRELCVSLGKKDAGVEWPFAVQSK